MQIIIELVDSMSRDGPDTHIKRHLKFTPYCDRVRFQVPSMVEKICRAILTTSSNASCLSVLSLPLLFVYFWPYHPHFLILMRMLKSITTNLTVLLLSSIALALLECTSRPAVMCIPYSGKFFNGANFRIFWN